ncbi:MAG: response regulator transcription factor [Deltaproteobacteria bacterium]|nr:response regulator transcription factor [Deltaproteobacteria bacterium]
MTKGSRASKPATRPLVLVVDDGRQHVTLLRLALMQRGFAVIVVLSEDGARTMLREKSIDAMVVTLPLDAGSALVSSVGEARPPVVLAVTSAEELSRAEVAGFDLAFARPIDFAELDAALRDRMARRTSGTRRRVKAKKPATS